MKELIGIAALLFLGGLTAINPFSVDFSDKDIVIAVYLSASILISSIGKLRF